MRRIVLVLLILAACGRRSPEATLVDGPDAVGEGADAAVEGSEPPGPAGPVSRPSAGLEADLAAAEGFFDSRPHVERSLRETGLDGVDGLGDALSAESCRACHAELYDEWRVSVHAQAWIDPQYQAEIGKSGNRWLCLACHTPLLVQQDRWPVGLVDGDVERPILVDAPRFDPALRDEGITCTACHLRDGAIHGPGLGGDAPHAVVADPDFRSGALCLACHQATAEYAGKGFVCTFRTGEEWRAGPHDDEGRTCVSCHMPAVERPAATGGPVRTVARHWWRGAGIPKFEGRYPPAEANPPGLGLVAEVDGGAIRVEMTNANAGHGLPTGDPERWVQVDVRFFDGDRPVGEAWQHRIGQAWAWEVPPRKVSDNRLAPRETRTERVPIPDGATRAEVEASSWRISEENAAYHHLGDYPRGVTTHTLAVPLP